MTPLPQWPAAERNKDVILQQLRRLLPPQGLVLEVASGTGQHSEHFARALPELTFQPSDVDEEHLEVLTERGRRAALPNLRGPVRLDATSAAWPIAHADTIYCANMLHISPWEAAQGLFAGAGRTLTAGGKLITYGPYQVGGEHTAESNVRFDASLRQRDPRWGVRDLEVLDELAEQHGLRPQERIPMPANNFTVSWEKR